MQTPLSRLSGDLIDNEDVLDFSVDVADAVIPVFPKLTPWSSAHHPSSETPSFDPLQGISDEEATFGSDECYKVSQSLSTCEAIFAGVGRLFLKESATSVLDDSVPTY